MPFIARSAATIRTALLADWKSRYTARGVDLDVTEDGDAYALADALAIEQEALELAAQESAHRVLVRETTGTDLDAFAEDWGTARLPASAARRHVIVTGSAATTYSISGRTLNSARGIAFAPIDTSGAALTSITTDGSGNYTLLAEAQTEGTVGNVDDGTVLTWSSAPSGMGATGEVTSGASTRDGEDEESDADLQTRILEIMRERPASGNRADVRSIALEITGVVKAYVYPLLAPAVVPPATRPAVGTPHSPGTWTVVVMGAAQGDTTTNTRVIGGVAGAELASHKGYFEGTHDALGNVRSSSDVFAQKRHITLEPENYTVEAVNVQAQNVVVQLVLDSSASWAWTGSALTASSSTTTSVTVSGNHSAKVGKDVLVFIGTSNTRGGWTKVRILTATYSSGPGTTEFTFAAVATAPTTAKGVYPAPSNWSSLRTAAFAHFDALGPSDVNTSTYPRSARFPPESWGDRATLYPLRLGADLTAVDGVLTADVTTPSSTVVPSQAKTLVTLGEFLVTQ